MEWNEHWPTFDLTAPIPNQASVFYDVIRALRGVYPSYTIEDIRSVHRWRLWYGPTEWTAYMKVLPSKQAKFAASLQLWLFGTMHDGSFFFLSANTGFDGWDDDAGCESLLLIRETPFTLIQKIPNEIRFLLFPDLKSPFAAMPKGFMPWDYYPQVTSVISDNYGISGSTPVGIYMDEIAGFKGDSPEEVKEKISSEYEAEIKKQIAEQFEKNKTEIFNKMHSVYSPVVYSPNTFHYFKGEI